MAYSVTIAAEAMREYEQIVSYLSGTLKSPSAAIAERRAAIPTGHTPDSPMTHHENRSSSARFGGLLSFAISFVPHKYTASCTTRLNFARRIGELLDEYHLQYESGKQLAKAA